MNESRCKESRNMYKGGVNNRNQQIDRQLVMEMKGTRKLDKEYKCADNSENGAREIMCV